MMNTKFLKMKNLFGKKNYWATKGLALLVLVMMGGSVKGQNYILNDNFGGGTFGSGNTGTSSPSGTSWIAAGSWVTSSSAYPAGQANSTFNCLKLGGSSSAGTISTTNNLNLSGNGGAFSISLDYKGWSTIEGNILISVNGGSSQTLTPTQLIASTTFNSSTLNFTGGTVNSYITIATSTKRAFIANVKVFYNTAPSAPTINSIISGNGQLSVAFTAGANGGSAITNYNYSTDGGSNFTACSPVQTTSPIVITGLTNGTSYDVQIKAVNAIGIGTATSSTAAIPGNNWTGTTNNNWNTSTNWSFGSVPTGTDYVVIATGNPQIDGDVTIGAGSTLKISGTGTLTINPTRTLTIAGTADFGGKSVTLKSNNTGTAAIGQITGTLSNASNLTVERYIPALRKFRFLSSPVVGATAANWRNNGTNTVGIGTQITGGTTLNNFDQSTTNAASAFWYNELLAASDVTVGSGATSDPGWTAFANGNTEALTNGKGFRILVRGDRTISLDGTGSVTPTNTTLSVTGTYPGASVSIATTKTNSNTNSGFNLVGNPYPATIDWNAVTKGADISATYTTYNPSSGAYVAWNGTTGTATQYIASGQAFFVQQTGTTGGITIAEANKATNAAGNYFRNKLADHLKLSMIYDSANYDAAFIHFRVDAQNDFDNYDGLKFQNAGVNIASVGTDGKRYNINSLASLSQTTEMPISILGSVLANYELKFEDVQSFKNHELYLIDTYLNKMLLLSEGFSYPIALSSDSASVKDGRLKIVFVQKTTGINPNEKNANAFLLYPNPASDAIHLLLDAKITNIENVAFEICNQLGAIIQFGNLDFTNAKDQSINIETLAQGIYFIKLQSNAQQQIIKFIK